MDQDSFRQLLQTPRIPGATPQHKGAQGASLQRKASGSSAPTFKPRKVKKSESKYRDRAAERRDGGKSDYAQVEAVLEVFEQRTANDDKDTVDEQRQYLGGDSEHTILVKGLDVSLLEQNKARAAASTEDDDTLEQAFIEASSEPTAHKKRTREDIIQELKAKRNGKGPQSFDTAAEALEDGARDLEKAKKAGKFKPISFKPIGQKDDKGTKKRSKEDSASRDKKRKKRKVEGISGSPQPANAIPHPEAKRPAVAPTSVAEVSSQVDQRPPSPLDDNMDIFAGAGDYEGFPGDDDSDEGGLDSPHKTESEQHINDLHASSEPARSRGWFGDEHDHEGSIQPLASTESATPQLPSSSHTPQVDEEEEESLRLKPLESSALPSIRDFLAMDAAAEKEDKRKARKEKRKNKKKSGGDDDD